MAADEEEAVLVCAMQSQVPMPVPGSLGTTCDDCHGSIWVDPRMLRAAADQVRPAHIRLLCLDCALRHAQMNGDEAELLRLLVRRGLN